MNEENALAQGTQLQPFRIGFPSLLVPCLYNGSMLRHDSLPPSSPFIHRTCSHRYLEKGKEGVASLFPSSWKRTAGVPTLTLHEDDTAKESPPHCNAKTAA